LTAIDSSPNVSQTINVGLGQYASIDFHHTGDGKSIAGSAPHLYVSVGSTTTVRYTRLAYSGGTWTAGSQRMLASKGSTLDKVSSIYDGTRLVVAYGYSAGDPVHIVERDEADTTTTTRTPTALSDGYPLNVSVSYDAAENIHLWVSGATSDDLKRIVYTRSAGTWDASWTTVLTGDIKVNSLSLKRGYSGGKLDAVFLDGTGTTADVTTASLSFESGSHVRIAAGTKAKVRDAAGTRPVVRLADATRLS
jgi:hypothetical protein